MLMLALPLLALAACGGGGKAADEDAVKANVQRFFASDPRGCDLETARMVRNTQDVATTAAAVESCKKRERQRQAGQTTVSPFAPTTGAGVSAVSVAGDTATAKAKLQGGDLDGQVLQVTLVKQGDVWKIDRIDGLRLDDRVRATYDKAFTDSIRTILQGKVPDAKLDETLSCIQTRFAQAVPNDRLADQYEGKLAPGTLSKAGEQAAQACLSATATS
jgi:hypothetical protein